MRLTNEINVLLSVNLGIIKTIQVEMLCLHPDLLLWDKLSYEALLRALPHIDVRVADLR